jgi:hypothetical protein
VNTYALWVALAVARGTLRVILFASFAVPFKTRKLFAVISDLNLAAEMNSVILNAILELEFVGGGGSMMGKEGGTAKPADCEKSRSV